MTFKAQSPPCPLASDSFISFISSVAVDMGVPGLAFSPAPLSWALASPRRCQERGSGCSLFFLLSSPRFYSQTPRLRPAMESHGPRGPNRLAGVWARASGVSRVDRIKLQESRTLRGGVRKRIDRKLGFESSGKSLERTCCQGAMSSLLQSPPGAGGLSVPDCSPLPGGKQGPSPLGPLFSWPVNTLY